MTTRAITATVQTRVNSSQGVNESGEITAYDVLTFVDEDGNELDTSDLRNVVTVEGAEDAEPYVEALAAAGWTVVDTAAEPWVVTRES